MANVRYDVRYPNPYQNVINIMMTNLRFSDTLRKQVIKDDNKKHSGYILSELCIIPPFMAEHGPFHSPEKRSSGTDWSQTWHGIYPSSRISILEFITSTFGACLWCNTRKALSGTREARELQLALKEAYWFSHWPITSWSLPIGRGMALCPHHIVLYDYGSKLGTPKLWMVNTELD